jgi:hypothetical protein
MMKSLPQIIIFPAVLGMLMFSGTSMSSAQNNQDSERIRELLSEAKGHALKAENDAATLESYARSRLSWKSHVSQLDAMKLHVNELGKIAGEMNDLQGAGSPWQQGAIQQVTPLLREMARNLTNAIEHLNSNQAQVHMPAFRDYARTNYELARRTADLISDFVDYDEAKSMAESLEQKLELAQNQQPDKSTATQD